MSVCAYDYVALKTEMLQGVCVQMNIQDCLSSVPEAFVDSNFKVLIIICIYFVFLGSK